MTSPSVGVHEDTSHWGRVHVNVSSEVAAVRSQSQTKVRGGGVVSNVANIQILELAPITKSSKHTTSDKQTDRQTNSLVIRMEWVE